MANKLAVMADSPSDYERLCLSPTTIAPWEEGRRTDDSAGTYEWWYFDAHLADGAKLVVTFMNKDIAEPQKSLEPYRPSSGLVMSGPARANAPCERMIKTIRHDCLHWLT